uniref:Uncharacterized protein n=1 Tax=Meloidogyne hapla TaxID=6305 RepID=A0A1I8BV67_MELHA
MERRYGWGGLGKGGGDVIALHQPYQENISGGHVTLVGETMGLMKMTANLFKLFNRKKRYYPGDGGFGEPGGDGGGGCGSGGCSTGVCGGCGCPCKRSRPRPRNIWLKPHVKKVYWRPRNYGRRRHHWWLRRFVVLEF